MARQQRRNNQLHVLMGEVPTDTPPIVAREDDPLHLQAMLSRVGNGHFGKGSAYKPGNFGRGSSTFGRGTNAGMGRGTIHRTKEEKAKLVCEHCNGTGHEISKCFKLHGYPDWYKQLREERGRSAVNVVCGQNKIKSDLF
ncbi:hypothetical protein DH2020_002941 [Rehmannia glutinosa]|uniref:Uncharacterized protein n=1 Tax=Rehmannia glutinosa TaxID=99300 RepID=A0ABR0XVR9_REHGL